jgi:hypothetical protein
LGHERAEERDEQTEAKARHQRASDRADAAEHYDHKGHDHFIEAHAGQDRRARGYQCRAKRDRRAFEHEDEKVDDLGVDTEQFGKLGVFGNRANDRSESRLLGKQPHRGVEQKRRYQH